MKKVYLPEVLSIFLLNSGWHEVYVSRERYSVPSPDNWICLGRLFKYQRMAVLIQPQEKETEIIDTEDFFSYQVGRYVFIYNKTQALA